MAKKSSKKTIKVNFKGVDAGMKVVPEADYAIKIKDVTLETGEESGKDYLKWALVVSRGPHKGTALKPYITTLQPQGLWNLRGLLEAFGQEVPDSTMDLDLDELKAIEEEAGCTVEHDTYQGRKQSVVVDVFLIANLDSDGDGKDGGDKNAGSDVTEEDILAMDEDELKEFNEEHDLDVDFDDITKLPKQRKAVAKAWAAKEPDEKKDGGDDLPDEDTVMAMDEEELTKCNEDHDLEVDFSDHKKLKDKRKAVWEAVEAKGEGGDAEKVTEDAINEMGKDELEKFNEEHELEVDLEGSTSKQRRAIIKAAKKKDLIEE